MKRHLFVSSSVLSIGLFCTFSAMAQDVSAPAETVVVTGSHIASPNYTSPTPVTSLSSDTLLSANASNVAVALLQLPILADTVTLKGSASTGNNGQTSLNLRNLGGGNTLVLLNGNRIAPTSVGAGMLLFATVDVQMLPLQLLQRVDVVTGGAGAVYGSDAVAGVVNFILNKNFNGVKGEVRAGVDDQGTNRESGLQLAVGTGFGGDRGHFEANAELYQNSGVYSIIDSKAGRRSCAAISNPAGAATTQSFQCGVTVTNGSFQGLITGGPLKGTTFDNAGNPVPFHYGTLVTGSTEVGGDGPVNVFAPGAGTQKNAALYQRTSWRFGADTNVYLDANYGYSDYEYQAGSYDNLLGGNAAVIQSDNAYLPASLKTAMAANKITNFTLGKYFADLPIITIQNKTATMRFVGGADGKLFGDWAWDAHIEHGQTNQQINALDDENISHFVNAVDAVVNPANGQIVCRSTLANPANGCVPFNIFGNAGVTPRSDGRGVNSATAAQFAYLTSVDWEKIRIMETDLAANVSGDAFQGWAGTISVATGFEWRNESMNAIASPAGTAINPLTGVPGPFLRGNFSGQAGSYSVAEGYVESDVPLLEDMPFVKKLAFNGAVRETNYSEVGGLSLTYKAGLVWDVIDEFRIRGTFSRDVRAPSLGELYAGFAPGVSSVIDYGLPGNPTNPSILANSGGNPNLKPQHGTTTTLGFVYTPDWLPGLQLSVDGYRILIANAIANYSTQQIVQFCYQGVTDQCPFIIRNPATGAITQVNQVPLNLSRLSNEGADFDSNYRFEMPDWTGIEGDFNLHGTANYVSQYIPRLPKLPVVNYAGQNGGGSNVGPQWRWTLQTGYTNGPFSLFTQARWTGSGWYDKSQAPSVLPLQHIGGQTLIDLNLQYAITVGSGSITPYFNVTDLFNDVPPPSPASGRINGYDVFGRHVRAGIRFDR